MQTTDVLIIGAGPSGSCAASLLRKKGYQVTVLEKQYFPRFSIGESLLPQCMAFLEQADMLEAVKSEVEEHGFQFKNGAAFLRGAERNFYNFTEKFSAGHGTTWQVRRAPFDHLLAKSAQDKGADIRFGHQLESIDFLKDVVKVNALDEAQQPYQIDAKFVLDGSGFGRILPKLLDLEYPSDFPVRQALFTHIEDNIQPEADFDREKILITVHEKDHRAWYWLIPFADGRSSFGVVAEPDFFQAYQAQLAKHDPSRADSKDALLQFILADDMALSKVLAHAKFDQTAQQVMGYSANVKQLFGDRFALLGNAGEFLDPVFSSGVTIALKSASMAVPLLDRELRGESVDWHNEYEKPLRQGIDVFRTYVESWYEGGFQDVVFSKQQNTQFREMISSILAGYAWDTTNPIVKDAPRRLNALVEICRDFAQQKAH